MKKYATGSEFPSYRSKSQGSFVGRAALSQVLFFEGGEQRLLQHSGYHITLMKNEMQLFNKTGKFLGSP
jgi:hypothetical protein